MVDLPTRLMMTAVSASLINGNDWLIKVTYRATVILTTFVGIVVIFAQFLMRQMIPSTGIEMCFLQKYGCGWVG